MSLYSGTVVLVVALWVPGLLVWAALGRRIDRLVAWAAGPAISLGLVHCLLVANYVANVPVTWWTYAALSSPFVIILAVRGRPRIGEFRRGRPGIDAALLGVAFVVGVALWTHAFNGPTPGLANVDGSHHAWVVNRIAELHTARPHEILVAIPSTGAVAGDYAPLGLHALGAFAVEATHLGAARVLQVLTLLFAGIAFPLGAFVLARRVSDNRNGIAGCAALLAASGALFPWGPMYWSLIALLAAISLVAAVGVCFTEAVETKGIGSLCACALALAGLFSVHNPEAFVALGLGVLLVVNRGLGQSPGLTRQLGVRSACVVGGFALLLAPFAPALVAGATERQSYQLSVFPNLGGFLRNLLLYNDFLSGSRGPAATVAAALLSVLSIVGAIWLVRNGQWALVSFGILLACLICFAGGHSFALLERVTAPWYHDPLRVAFTLGVCLPVFAAQGLVIGVEHFSATRRSYLFSGATTLALIVAPFVARVSGAQAQFRAAALPLSADSAGAFDYLKQHAVSSGHEVLNDSDADGSLWASVEGIPTVYGLWAPNAVDLPDWKALTLLRADLPQVCDRPDLRSIVSRFDLRYVLVVGASFPVPTTPSLLSAERLDTAPGLTIRYQSGRSRVYEIDAACR